MKNFAIRHVHAATEAKYWAKSGPALVTENDDNIKTFTSRKAAENYLKVWVDSGEVVKGIDRVVELGYGE